VNLRLLTPTAVVLDRPVDNVVAEGRNGSFGLRPRHIDFVTALVPGILYFEPEGGGTDQGEYAAVDRGVLVKQGDEVLVSVRNAVHGVALEELVRAVHTRFLDVGEQERVVRSAVARLESDFVRRFVELS